MKRRAAVSILVLSTLTLAPLVGHTLVHAQDQPETDASVEQSTSEDVEVDSQRKAPKTEPWPGEPMPPYPCASELVCWNFCFPFQGGYCDQTCWLQCIVT